MDPTTQPNSLTIAYRWKINEFSSRCANEIAGFPVIRDETVHFSHFSKHAFHVELWPKGEDEESSGDVSLFLHLDSCPVDDEVLVNYKFYIEKPNGESANMHCAQAIFQGSDNAKDGCSRFISRVELFDATKQYMHNDTLTLFIAVQILFDKNLTQSEKENYLKLFEWEKHQSSRTSWTDKTKANESMESLKLWNVWKIDNFSGMYQNMNGHPLIESREVSPQSREEFKFKLQLYPNGVNEKANGYVSAFVNLKSIERKMNLASLQQTAETRVLYRIAVLDKSWQLVNIQEQNENFEVSNSYGFGNFIHLNQLASLLQNDALLLFWQVEIILNPAISDEEFAELNESFQAAMPPLEKGEWHDYFNAMPNSLTTAYQWRVNRFSTRIDSKIAGFPVIHDEPGQFDISPEHKFHVYMRPKGDDNESSDHVSLYLRVDSYPTDQVLVNYKFYIENAIGERCNPKGGQFNFLQELENWGYGEHKFISHAELFDATNRYVTDDALTLFLVVQILLHEDLTETEKQNYEQLFYCKEYSSSRISITG